jgi:hypothetical protein
MNDKQLLFTDDEIAVWRDEGGRLWLDKTMGDKLSKDFEIVGDAALAVERMIIKIEDMR